MKRGPHETSLCCPFVLRRPQDTRHVLSVQMLPGPVRRGVASVHFPLVTRPGLCRSRCTDHSRYSRLGWAQTTFFYLGHCRPGPGLETLESTQVSDDDMLTDPRDVLSWISLFCPEEVRCIRLPTKQSRRARLGIVEGINNSFPGCSYDQNDFLFDTKIICNNNNSIWEETTDMNVCICVNVPL